MADAKIVIDTLANNEGLQKLNTALAEGAQNLKAMQTELRGLEKETNNGSKATAEQAKRMTELRKAIQEQKIANKELSNTINGTVKEIRNQVKAMSDADKGARGLADRFGSLKGFTSAVSVALGTLAGNILTKVAAGAWDAAKAVASLGLGMNKQVAELRALGMSGEQALGFYRTVNDIARDTNFSEGSVQKMATDMLNLGISSGDVAKTLKIVTDAAVGLKTGEQGAVALADTMAKILATGRLSQKQIDALKISGIDAVKVLADASGQSQEEIAKALSKGAIDGKEAYTALAAYMENEFAGSMAIAKDNVLDNWGDLTGNITTAMAEMGNSIMEGFNQTGVIQELVDMTQAFVDLLRSDGIGIMDAFGAVGKAALSLVADLLGGVNFTIKMILIVGKEMADGFKSWCNSIYESLSWLIDPLVAIYDKVKSIVGMVGKDVAEYADTTFKKTFPGGAAATGTPEVQLKNRAITGNEGTVGTNTSLIKSYEAVAKAQKQVIKNQQDMNKEQDLGAIASQKLTTALQSSAAQILQSDGNMLKGLANAFANFAQSVIKDLMEIAVKALIVNAITGLFGKGGGIKTGYSQVGLNPVQAKSLFGGGYANGGVATGWSLVGERGPELVNFSQPGRVYTANETSKMMSGGDTNIKVELINNTGTEIKTEQGGTRWDAATRKYVVSVVMNAVNNNEGGMRDMLKGAMA